MGTRALVPSPPDGSVEQHADVPEVGADPSHFAIVKGSFRTLAMLVAATVGVTGPAVAGEAPAFSSSVASLTAAERAAMTPSVWRRGCPVSLAELRVVRARHWTFAGRVRTGRLVVHRDAAADVVSLLRDLYTARFPIRQMVPIERYEGSDFASIEADNTSAFNCRYVDGTRRWSQHASGRAIDINPIENPYVTNGGTTAHRASRPFVARSPVRPGMLVEDSAALKAIDRIGWGWGGRWRGTKDYQHISASGR